MIWKLKCMKLKILKKHGFIMYLCLLTFKISEMIRNIFRRTYNTRIKIICLD